MTSSDDGGELAVAEVACLEFPNQSMKNLKFERRLGDVDAVGLGG